MQMKAKINIELWDDTTKEEVEEAGVTEKFLEMCYKLGYEGFTKNICVEGMKYKVSVEIEDNTAQN